ncbi:lipid A deacylase LpxR family protein [Pedobacter arcticus]|uniref:lipid A deacylase LpxR family protein n=1 Tax=Pedobacter arcticus TaxID=752140 RepID=UPI000376C619
MRFILSFFAFILLTLQSFSQEKIYQNELGFRSDNDAYLGTKQDRYYTNGLFIHFRRAIENKNDSTTKKIWSLNLGHEMYNARSGQITEIENVDRPFASYLYAGGSLQWLKPNENILKLAIQMGTIGPAALGKEVQTVLHDFVGFYDISGWQYQVNDEFGVNLKLNLQYFLFRNKNKNLDFSLPINVSLGNTFTGLDAGILFRTGSINPFYHSVATQSNIATKVQTGLKKQEFYFFLKPALTYVAYNATIQGGLFVKDKGPVTYKPIPFVFSQQIGASYANKRFTVDLSVIFKSKELASATKSEQYGSVAFYYRF